MTRFLDRTALSAAWQELLAMCGLFVAVELLPRDYSLLAGMVWVAALYLVPANSRRRVLAAYRRGPDAYRAGWQGTKFRRKRSARDRHGESR